MSICLEVDQVSFAYPQKPAVLEDISFQFHAGSYTWLRGPSGCGKSTLLRLLCRLLEPSRGRILFKDQPLAAIEPSTLRRQVVYLHQTPVILDGSVAENLLLPFSFKANQDLTPPDTEEMSARLEEFLLQGVSLETPATNLSVGQKQRLCLLRAMLVGPSVLLLDEPTAALDKESTWAVLQVLQRLNRKQGVTIILVSHGDEILGHSGVQILEFCRNKIYECIDASRIRGN
jgi:UDP-glucose/iron transport system ATP-binding protein